MKTIKTLLLFTLLSGAMATLAQGPPPAMAMPSANDSRLIDELVNTSGLKDFVINYCASRIRVEGQKKNWDSAKINEKISHISFDEFKKIHIYNNYSLLNADELTLLIKFFKSAQQRNMSQQFFLANAMLLRNLNSYSERYLTD